MQFNICILNIYKKMFTIRIKLYKKICLIHKILTMHIFLKILKLVFSCL